jgi:uncharacterized protein (DUF1778 family)/GNAT superfamily N-acetyltransferase
MATTRIDIRLDEAVKAKAEKASALLGSKSLTEFIVQTMDERSSEVLSEYERMTVSDDVFDQFTRACEKADEPNEALRAAAGYSKRHGF